MSAAEGYVLVIGSAGIDVRALPDAPLEWGVNNTGAVRNTVGGVARNIAENLSLLEVETVLLTAVGRDDSGRRVVRHSRERGIDCGHVRRVAGARTLSQIALLKPEGDLLAAISDFEIMQYVDAPYLLKHESLFMDAALVVIDATLTREALATVFDLAARYNVRVCADPTSPELVSKLVPYIPQLFLLTPNAAETQVLCGLDAPAHDRETALKAARQLVTDGAEIAVVTLGENGLAYADGSGGGYIRAIHTNVVDPTGAGDAFSGAVIFGLLNEVPVDEAMRLGVTAASLTLQTRETVMPDLTQELLYARLMI